MNTSGLAWVEANIGAKNGYQPYWPTVFEPRYIDAFINQIRADGLLAR